ncbi:MAG: PIN domain-containing protein [Burkholderiales bacterium]|nr:PIN domain-containing protein [Phycisphaerae bacterium]
MGQRPVVLDTSVLLSYLLNPGKAYAVREAIQPPAGMLLAVTCESVIAELRDVGLRYADVESVDAFLREYRIIAKCFPDPPSRFIHATDPKDSQFFDLAIEANAEAIISFDEKHILSLRDPMHPQHHELFSIVPNLRLAHPKEMALDLGRMRSSEEG